MITEEREEPPTYLPPSAEGGVFREELTPVNWIERAGEVHADRQAVVDGPVAYTWKEFRDRSRRLASALRRAGLKKDDRVALWRVQRGLESLPAADPGRASTALSHS